MTLGGKKVCTVLKFKKKIHKRYQMSKKETITYGKKSIKYLLFCYIKFLSLAALFKLRIFKGSYHKL